LEGSKALLLLALSVLQRFLLFPHLHWVICCPSFDFMT
jgi:hypothetical protein